MKTSYRIALYFLILSIIASAAVYWHIPYIDSTLQVLTILPNAITVLIINNALSLGYRTNQIPFLVCYIAVNLIYGVSAGHLLNRISKLTGNTKVIFIISLIPYFFVAAILYGMLFINGGS